MAGHSFVANGSPASIVRAMLRTHRSNGINIGEQEVWDYCNQIWRTRDPSRAMQAPRVAETTREPGTQHIKTDPYRYGPDIWPFLHRFGMRHSFDKTYWIATIDWIKRLLDPDLNPDTGCSECLEHFSQMIRDIDPATVETPAQAAAWVLEAHNRVNQRNGRAVWTSRAAAIRYNTDIPA